MLGGPKGGPKNQVGRRGGGGNPVVRGYFRGGQNGARGDEWPPGLPHFPRPFPGRADVFPWALPGARGEGRRRPNSPRKDFPSAPDRAATLPAKNWPSWGGPVPPLANNTETSLGTPASEVWGGEVPDRGSGVSFDGTLKILLTRGDANQKGTAAMTKTSKNVFGIRGPPGWPQAHGKRAARRKRVSFSEGAWAGQKNPAARLFSSQKGPYPGGRRRVPRNL